MSVQCGSASSVQSGSASSVQCGSVSSGSVSCGSVHCGSIVYVTGFCAVVLFCSVWFYCLCNGVMCSVLVFCGSFCPALHMPIQWIISLSETYTLTNFCVDIF